MKYLKEKFGLEEGKRGVANRDLLYTITRQDTYRALSLAVEGKDPPCIWDRLFVSEFVYADIVGRPCEFSSQERRFVVDLLNMLTCPMIACLPPYEVVKENSAKVHQMAGVKEGLAEIYLRYDEGDLPWPEHTIWYDYTGGHGSHFATLEQVEEEVAGYLEERKARSSAWAS